MLFSKFEAIYDAIMLYKQQQQQHAVQLWGTQLVTLLIAWHSIPTIASYCLSYHLPNAVEIIGRKLKTNMHS